MAQWKQDPQEREDIEEVSKELELPVYKPSALGKFRPWLKECWNKLEDYLINLKELANSKENFIKDKKTGFNLDKTNLTENASDKLFTAKGALDLFNRLTTAINTAVENMKNVLRVDIAKKIDKTSISDSLTSTSQTTVLSSAGAKALEDKKLNIVDAWKYQIKLIGNAKTETDLNDIREPGEYASIQNINKFRNTPADYVNLAFNLTVETINLESNYRTQTLKSYNDTRTYKRIYANGNWSAWERIDGGDRLLRSIEGDLEGVKRGTNGIFLSSGNTLNFSSNNNLYHFNYHTFPGSQQISTFYLNNGDSKGGMADFYAKNITARGGNLVIDSQSDAVWSNLRLMTRDGFWRLEAHPESTSTGNRRCNLIFRDNATKKDIIVAFPDVGANGETLAYRSWITWGNVSGKPSSFPPSSHTHDDKLNVSEAWKYNSKEIGNTTSTTNLDNILEPGDYNSTSSANKFTSLPADYNNGAFNLKVEAINKNSPNYRTQILKSFVDSRIYKRVYIKDGNKGWSAWERIDSVKIKKIWNGNHGVVNTTVCTLPSDWKVAFIQINWYSAHTGSATTEVLFRETRDFIGFGIGEEYKIKIDESNRLMLTSKGDAGWDASIRAVHVLS